MNKEHGLILTVTIVFILLLIGNAAFSLASDEIKKADVLIDINSVR